MGEGAEVEDRVDFDEDNYVEDVDEDIEEQLDEDVEGGDKHDVDDDGEERDSESESSGEDQSPQMERSHASAEPAEDEEERPAPLSGDDKDKHAELLSLPPHGSEVFIGGLPRDILEEDLRDLCEPSGEVYEVGKIRACFFCCHLCHSVCVVIHLFYAMDFQVRVIKDRGTGESKGYAFVAFRTREEAQKAIEELHSKEFKVILELPFFFSI